MSTISLSINGQKINSPAGASILDAASKNGIRIPTLCHHPDLKPYGACRICLVEDEKSGRLMASCVTPVLQDMSIITDSPRVLNHRRNIVRLMMAEHPESCIVCSKGNRCELRGIAANLGVGETDLYPMPNFKPYEELNPFIIRDLSKCILCGKCIRADHELVNAYAIDYNNRGFLSRPATVHETPLEKSICTFCGTCVSMCPTGALSVKNSRFVGTPESESVSICGFCGIGCSLSLGVAGGKVVDVNPSRIPGTVNGPTLCVRGHFANDFMQSADRLTFPTIRRKTESGETAAVAVNWDKAIETVAANLSEIKRHHGPDSIAFVGSTKCTNEENYLFQKIARVIFETPNVASGNAGDQNLLAKIEEKTFGCQRTAPLSALETAQAILVVDADLDNTLPVAAYHVKRAFKNGVPVVVINPFRSEVARFADAWLRPLPAGRTGTSSADIVDVLSAQFIAAGTIDAEFIERTTEGFAAYKQHLSGLDTAAAAKKAGIRQKLIDKAVNAMSGRKLAVVTGSDILSCPDGSRTVDALLNLVLLTGSIGEKGSGFFIASSQNNLNGAFDMGANPGYLPGRRTLDSADNIDSINSLWGARIPAQQGMNLEQIITAAETGKLKALYIMGENLLRALPQSERAAAALKKLDFIVAQDVVQNRTTEIAHVVLPGAVFAEKAGSFTNMEGRIQSFAAAVTPPGDARPDWMILAQLIKKMGHPEQYLTLEKIRQEIRRVVPMYERLGNHRQDWVKSPENQTPFSSGAIRFGFTVSAPAAAVAADPKFPYVARIGSLRHHLGSGTRTSRSARIRAWDNNGFIEISPADCALLSLGDSGSIRVTSAFGEIERAFSANPDLPEGMIFVPLAVHGNDALNLAALEGPEGFCRVNIKKVETPQE